MSRWGKALERGMAFLFLLCGLTAVGAVLAISLFLVAAGLPAIRTVGLRAFLTGKDWSPAGPDPRFGILPMLLTSVYGAAAAVAIGAPVGFAGAVFLAKAAPPKLAYILRQAVALLASVPSVAYGLVGMTVVVPWVQKTFRLPAGDTLLSAVLVLSVMILPSVVMLSENALSAVPSCYEEASLALGATKIETWFRVSAPAAKNGILSAVALGVGRAIGEAMAVLMVAGNVTNMPSLLSSVRFLTTGVAMELGYAAVGSLQRDALYSIGLVLFLFILLVVGFLRLLRRGGSL